MPIWIVPGTADNTVILELGYGRNGNGRIANGVGFNTYVLRDSEAFWKDFTVTVDEGGFTLSNNKTNKINLSGEQTSNSYPMQ